jgi:hypothetical protein
MGDIGVAHLVRARNGIQPFRSFLESYERCRGGVSHDLLIIFKGFSGRAEAEPYRELLKPFGHKEVFVSDVGFDLRAYSVASRHFKYSYFCFLNSFSIFLDENWLAKISALAVQPGIGLVGATGSYESMYTSLLTGQVHHKSEGGIFPAYMGEALHLRLNKFFFSPFPNPHIRTTAFMLQREVMLKVWPRYILTKASAYFFENGKRSLTRRIQRLGLKVLVTGKDGRAYETNDWAGSNTFRQSAQENLLVADNQTRQYTNADFDKRKQLSRLSWGDQANPAQP